MSIFERVKKVTAAQLGVNESEIQMESSFINDLDADSLDIVELIMAFEDEFDVEINDDAAEKIKTVEDAVNFIGELTK